MRWKPEARTIYGDSMTDRTIAPLLWTMALLAGCGGHPAKRNEQAAVNIIVADDGKPVGVANSISGRTVARDLPTAFQGHWGLTAADCDLSRPDAPGLMKIRGNVLDFQASTARVRTLRSQDGYHVVAELDVRAGGRTEQHSETLALELGGTRLTRTVPGGTLRYEHC